jgi:hypothetical protein
MILLSAVYQKCPKKLIKSRYKTKGSKKKLNKNIHIQVQVQFIKALKLLIQH